MTPFDTCAVCPRLCRDACPVATGSAREAAVPANIGHVLRAWRLGRASDAVAREAATLCVDCGGCREACHVHQPLPELLRGVRAVLVEPPAPAPLEPIEGEGDLVAVEADQRPFASVLARKVGRPVRRWPTRDRLGADAIESRSWPEHARQLRERAVRLTVVVVDGGSARALTAAGIAPTWAHELVGAPAAEPTPGTGGRCVGSCVVGGQRPLLCCGAAAPLVWAHPDDARRVARTFADRMDGDRLVDARCRAHLRAAGVPAADLLDRWLEEEP